MTQHPLYADKVKDDVSEDSGDDEVIDMNFEQDSSSTITTHKPATCYKLQEWKMSSFHVLNLHMMIWLHKCISNW